MDFITSSKTLLEKLQILGRSISTASSDTYVPVKGFEDIFYNIGKKDRRGYPLTYVPRVKTLDSNDIGVIRSLTLSEIARQEEKRNKSLEYFGNLGISEDTINHFYPQGSFEMSTGIRTTQLSDDFWDSLDPMDWYTISQKAIEYLDNQERLSTNLTILRLVNKIQASLKSLTAKFKRNQREIFRKINSFLFKNMDDYHSAALVIGN